MTTHESPAIGGAGDERARTHEDLDLIDVLAPLRRHWLALIAATLLAGALAVGVSYLVKPVFSARTSFITPQQSQAGALGAALSSLGSLASLSGAPATRTTGDLYVSLLQSSTLSDRIIERYRLREAYELKYRFEARQALMRHVRVALGKKDGLISVEVDDTDPQRAADIANRYVEELRAMTADLALTEAQRRRQFFEGQIKQSRDRLTQAQQALQGTGFGSGALRAEPKAAAEEYARVKAEVTAAEVRLQALQRNLTPEAPEVAQQQTVVAALRSQLRALERSSNVGDDADYIGRYREFKYQETLFDLLARQYESAKLDESREDVLIQIVDRAERPEWKSWPKRSTFALVAAAVTFAALALWLVARHLWRRSPRRAPP